MSSDEQTPSKAGAVPAGAEHGHRPGTVAAAAAVAAAQAVALGAWGLYVMLAPLFSSAGDLLRAEGGGLTLLVTGALPGIAAVGLWRLKRWGRGPAAATNLCCLPVGWTIWQQGGGLTWIGVAVMAVAVAGLACLISRETGRALDVYRTASR